MKTIVLIFALIALICSSPSGGYSSIDTNDLLNLSNNDMYKSAEAKAR